MITVLTVILAGIGLVALAVLLAFAIVTAKAAEIYHGD